MKQAPDHNKFIYHPRDLEPSGAIKGCRCDQCEAKRTAEQRTASDSRAA